jgi:chaperonin GroES
MEENKEFMPLFERVLIKPDSVETKTETGIILPVEARKRPNTGIVIALGHSVPNNTNCPVQVGDKVLYLRYSGMDVKVNGDLHHLVMANDLVAIINKNSGTTIEISDYA